MGITIHYRGKAKNEKAINDLIEMLEYFAKEQSWEFQFVNEHLKGSFYPPWGYGYGYIPKRERLSEEGIEFFPKMVSTDCNGYFHLFDTQYAEEVRRSLRRGKTPEFTIDTIYKGIYLDVHAQCETLGFCFDMNTLELANYRSSERSKGIIGFNGFHCKTQFAGFEMHKIVCALIKATERYIDYTLIDDEAGFYHMQDDNESRKEFEKMTAMIESFGTKLKEMGKRRGIEVQIGAEVKR